MASSRKSYEVPNGGFGWYVVFGATLINMFNQSLLSVFGLLFGGYFTALNESKVRIALVMNLSSTFLNLTGFLIGPLTKIFTKRKIAVTGCLLVSFGLMLSSITTSLNQVILTYSLCVGVGLGLLGPAIFISVSEYFTTRKSRAVALTMSGTGFGQMILPQVVKFFLMEYGFRGTILLMGGLSLHGVIGACLFQPVEWHMRRRVKDTEEITESSPLMKRSPSTSLTFGNINGADENNISIWKKIQSSMDLSLLKDPRFVILNFGLACTYTVSIDFTLILPFFLQV
jgi:MFS family permease